MRCSTLNWRKWEVGEREYLGAWKGAWKGACGCMKGSSWEHEREQLGA